MYDFARLDRHVVKQLERFLRLHGANDGSDSRCGGDFTEQDVLAGEQRTGVAHRQVAAGLLVERTLKARAFSGNEDPYQSKQFLNGAVYPGLFHPISKSVERQPGFAVIEAADDHIHAANDAQTKLGCDIAVVILNVNTRIEFLDPRRGDLSFAPARIALAKERRAGEVGGFDRIKIQDKEVARAHEGQVFNHLVAQSACPDDQNFGFFDALALPPGDEIEGAQAVSA